MHPDQTPHRFFNEAQAAVHTASGGFKVFSDVVSKMTVSRPKVMLCAALAIGAFAGDLFVHLTRHV